jgi:hypothetical protein
MSFCDSCTQSALRRFGIAPDMLDNANVPALSILGRRTSSGRDRIWQCRREPHGTTSTRGVAMMSFALSALSGRSRIASSRKAARNRFAHAPTSGVCAQIMLETKKDKARRRFDATPSCSDGQTMEEGRALPRRCAIFSGPYLTRIFCSTWNRRPRQGVCRPGKGPMETRKLCSRKSFPQPRSAQWRS